MLSKATKGALFFILRPVFMLLNYLVPRQTNLWVFQVGRDHAINGNLAAFLDYVVAHAHQDQRTVKLLALHPQQVNIAHVPAGVQLVQIESLLGFWLTLRCRVLVLQHQRCDQYFGDLNTYKRLIVNLWHGIPIKAVRHTIVNEQLSWQSKRWRDHRLAEEKYSAIISSSNLDRLAMSACFQMPFKDVWLTGLPRTDALLNPERVEAENLPISVAEAFAAAKKIKGKRKLVLYAPTFRQHFEQGEKRYCSGLFPLTEAQHDELEAYLRANDLVLGVRTHGYFSPEGRAQWQYSDVIVDCGNEQFADIQGLLLAADAVVTDYSSLWLDFMLRDKPMFAWVYDRSKYQRDRGWLYNIDDVFPGEMGESFEDFMQFLTATAGSHEIDHKAFDYSKSLFYKYLDGECSARVYAHILASLSTEKKR